MPLIETLIVVSLASAAGGTRMQLPANARKPLITCSADMLTPIASSTVMAGAARAPAQWADPVWRRPDPLAAGLARAGVDEATGHAMVNAARTLLQGYGFEQAQMRVDSTFDPEEELWLVTARLVAPVSLERALELDLELTHALVEQFTTLPYRFTVSIDAA